MELTIFIVSSGVRLPNLTATLASLGTANMASAWPIKIHLVTNGESVVLPVGIQGLLKLANMDITHIHDDTPYVGQAYYRWKHFPQEDCVIMLDDDNVLTQESLVSIYNSFRYMEYSNFSYIGFVQFDTIARFPDWTAEPQDNVSEVPSRLWQHKLWDISDVLEPSNDDASWHGSTLGVWKRECMDEVLSLWETWPSGVRGYDMEGSKLMRKKGRVGIDTDAVLYHIGMTHEGMPTEWKM